MCRDASGCGDGTVVTVVRHMVTGVVGLAGDAPSVGGEEGRIQGREGEM